MTESQAINSANSSSNLAEAPVRVLSVDDEAGFLKVTKQILEGHGVFQVDTALSVDEAMSKMKKTTYDAIVSDYQMAGKDGLQFLKEVRDGGNDIPFILFTGKGRESIAIQALNLGADQYFNKLGDPETVYGELVHGISQAVERRRAEEEVAKARDEYLSITNLTGDIIVNIDIEGRWTFLNDVACTFWGKPRKELLGQKFREYLHPEDSENTAAAAIQETIETRQIVRGVINRQRTPRGWRMVEWNGAPLFDAAGDYIGYQATGRDVTEHMNAEEALANSEKKYRELVETSQDMIYTLDPKGKFLFTNKTWNNRVGFSKEEIEGLNGFELIHPEDFKATIERFSDVLEGKWVENVEFRSRVKDGSYIDVLTNGSPVLDPQGNVVAVLGAARDITERKKAENSLRNRLQFESMVSKISANLINAPTSELDKTVSEALKIICQFMDAERCSIFLFSDNCTKLTNTHEWCSNPKDSQMSLLQGLPVDAFGYYFTILKKLKMIVINRPDDLPNEAKNERKWSEEHGFRPLVFVPMIHKGALYGTVGYYGKVDKEQVWSKDAIGYLNILSDIFVNAMEHKRFEEEIKGLARFPSENPNPVLRIAKDGTILYANAASKSLLNEWKREVGQSAPDYWSQKVAASFASDSSVLFELEHLDRVFSFEVSPVIDTGYVNVYGRDITERKKAEEEIRKFKTISDRAGYGLAIANLEGDLIYVNESFAEMHGFTADELIGKSLSIFHTVEQRENVNRLKDLLKQKGVYVGEEVWHKRRDDSTFPTLMNGTLIMNEKGKPLFIAATAIEITERKKAENALQESEERYRSLFESAREGMIITSPNGKILRMNRAAATILGYDSPEELIGTNAVDLYLDPEDREVMFKKIMDKGYVEHFEVTFKKKDGSPIHILGSNLTRKDEEGNLVQIEAFFMDITERKMREEEMKRRLMRFRLDDGNLYLVKESSPALSLEAFKDLLNVGYHGLVFSRTPEEEYKKNVDGNFEFRWLAERGGEKSLSPKFDKIENILEKLEKKSVVLLDGLDYLVLKNGFKKTLFFVQRLREMSYLAGNIVILSVDPATLSAREVRLLEKEGREVEPQVFVRLPEDLLEILRFIYEHNALGSKPNYTDIRQELSISKPTVGKRIKSLVNTGYVTVNSRGRSKVLELTYKGMRIFLK